MDEIEARSPVLTEVNGLRIAFLSYNAILEATFAGPSSPGVAYGSEGNVRHDVAYWKERSDVVIVALHAGTEYTDAPNGTQLAVSRAAVEAGAALVLGHHSHVLQGWGTWGDGVIVYSLGNFVFDLDGDDLRTFWGSARFRASSCVSSSRRPVSPASRRARCTSIPSTARSRPPASVFAASKNG